MASAIAILTFFFYLFFGAADVQKWDYSTDTYLESPQSYSDSATASLSSSQQHQQHQQHQQDPLQQQSPHRDTTVNTIP